MSGTTTNQNSSINQSLTNANSYLNGANNLITSGLSDATSDAQSVESLVRQSQISSILAPSGVNNMNVGSILSAATNIGPISNTVNAGLSTFMGSVNDPIQKAFSTGQKYAGTFITSATAVLTPLLTDLDKLFSSTIGVALLSVEQLAALVERFLIDIFTDVDLTKALVALFEEYTGNRSAGWGTDLNNTDSFNPYTYPTITSTTYPISSITYNPNPTSLINFINQYAGNYPNTRNIGGIISSVWSDGLGTSVNSDGTPIPGISSELSPGVWSDVISNANTFSPSTPITQNPINYSNISNNFNTTTAIALDNGLTGVLPNLLSSPSVNENTINVIQNRIPSIANRGDTGLIAWTVSTLGPSQIPNPQQVISGVVSNATPSDVVSSIPSPSVVSTINTLTNGQIVNGSVTNNNNTNSTTSYNRVVFGNPANYTTSTNSEVNTTYQNKVPVVYQAGGSPIDTTVPNTTLAQIINNITIITTTLGITVPQAFSQNTCNSVMCNTNLINVSLVKLADPTVLAAVMDPTTVQMAYMF